MQTQKQSTRLEPFSVYAFALPLNLIITSNEGGLAAPTWSEKLRGTARPSRILLHCQQWLNF